ncbi:MAG: HDOD domain-containing protein [Nitrosomonas sp. PRO4]|nr:HDOD domain-containing protein [Nitrosomonas sp. PRO4]
MTTGFSNKAITSHTGDISTARQKTSYSIKEMLLSAVNDDPNLPSLGGSLSYIIRLSSSEDESLRQLSHFILSDVSLAQKILSLSNSISFRSSSARVITSITKAIFLLGFDTVKTCALTILLVDGMMTGKRADYVRTELIYAVTASMVSRELAKYNQFISSEEVAIASLFKNMGRLLLAAYAHDKYEEMMTLAAQGLYTPEQASMRALNFDLSEFTEIILNKWNIPFSIIQLVKNKPMDIAYSPKNKCDGMRLAIEFSEKAVPLIIRANNNPTLESTLLSRFGKALDLDKSKLDLIIEKASEETSMLQTNAHLPPLSRNTINADMKDSGADSQSGSDMLTELALTDTKATDVAVVQRYPSGKPYNASVLLLSAIQDVTEMMATNYKLNNLIMLALEHYYHGLGFRFVTLCLRNNQKHQYQARSTVGKIDAQFQKAFCFSAVLSTDLFCLAMEKDTDLFISDTSVSKVREMLPHWYLAGFPDARSFIVLPLVINKKPLGFIYADREHAAPEGITLDETKLIKTLKGQILTALNSK